MDALATGDSVVERVAELAGLQENSGVPLDETLRQALRSRQLLLLLDNCEHVLESCTDLITSLLTACPELRVLATSREPLRTNGEVVFTVPPLSFDPHDSMASAVQLFFERAGAVRSEYVPSPQMIPLVREVCERLEGIPLAIELAAARVRVLTLPQIAHRLDDGLRLLVGGTRTSPLRQQTLRATLEWSYRLADENTRTVFERLGVFAGGFTLEAAESICVAGEIRTTDVLPLLERLLDCSLVIADPVDAVMRYRLHATVRQFALECLERSDVTGEIRHRHAVFFTHLAEQAAAAMLGPAEPEWLNRLDLEHDNLRMALRHMVDTGKTREAERMAAALHRYWFFRGHLSEGRASLTDVLGMADEGEPRVARGALLTAAAALAMAQADPEAARQPLACAQDIWRALDDEAGQALTCFLSGSAALMSGNRGKARLELERGRTLAHVAGLQVIEGLNLLELARVAAEERLVPDAQCTAESALDCFTVAQWKRGIVPVLVLLGQIRYFEGAYAAARQAFDDGLALARDLLADWWVVAALVGLAQSALQAGDVPGASVRLAEALQLGVRVGDGEVLMCATLLCVKLAMAKGDDARASRLHAAIQHIGAMTRFPRVDPLRTISRGPLPGARAPVVLSVEAEIRMKTWEQVMAEAIAVCELSLPDVSPRRADCGLTSRELEVLRMVVEGKTNAQIATSLVLSDKTVKRHLSNIFDKLGVNSRAAATSFAVRNGLA